MSGSRPRVLESRLDPRVDTSSGSDSAVLILLAALFLADTLKSTKTVTKKTEEYENKYLARARDSTYQGATSISPLTIAIESFQKPWTKIDTKANTDTTRERERARMPRVVPATATTDLRQFYLIRSCVWRCGRTLFAVIGRVTSIHVLRGSYRIARTSILSDFWRVSPLLHTT